MKLDLCQVIRFGSKKSNPPHHQAQFIIQHRKTEPPWFQILFFQITKSGCQTKNLEFRSKIQWAEHNYRSFSHQKQTKNLWNMALYSRDQVKITASESEQKKKRTLVGLEINRCALWYHQIIQHKSHRRGLRVFLSKFIHAITLKTHKICQSNGSVHTYRCMQCMLLSLSNPSGCLKVPNFKRNWSRNWQYCIKTWLTHIGNFRHSRLPEQLVPRELRRAHGRKCTPKIIRKPHQLNILLPFIRFLSHAQN